MSSYNYLQLQFISKYRAEHNIPAILNDDAVVEQIKNEMIKTGKVYPAFEALITPKSDKGKSNKSVFGEGYIKPAETFDGLKVENIGKKPLKRTLNPLQKSSVRNFISAFLLEEIKQTCNEFNIVANPNLVSGQEFIQEMEIMASKLVHALDLGKLGINEPENRKNLKKEINNYFRLIAELQVYANDPEEFDKRYQQIMKKPLDYNVVYEYMEAASKVDNSKIQNKYANLKKLQRPAEKLQGAIETPIQKRLDKWANRSANLGGLADFAITLVMMYYTGASSAISKTAQSVGKSVTQTATQRAAQMGMKQSASEIAGQVAGITSAQVTGAAINAAAFQTMNTIGSLQDGSLSAEETEMLAESTWGLTKFGYVASALTGPLGMKFAQLVNNAIINKYTLAIIKSSAIKPTTLGNVLTTLVKNSNFATKTTEIVSQFAMNAEYMAIDEGISYEESVKSLAQMEGISKPLIAMMSGKATAFLTNYKVAKVVHLGQDVYKITRPDGKTDIIPSEDALMFYMLDRLAAEGEKSSRPATPADKEGVNEDDKSSRPTTPADKKGVNEGAAAEDGHVAQEAPANQNITGFLSHISEVKSVQQTEFNSWEDIEQNKKNLGKDFSAVQMEIMKQYAFNNTTEIVPERLAVLERILNTEFLTPDEVIKLITSEKIPHEELLKIDEYAKVAKEKGFDIVKMMESTEQDFNIYVEQESQRIAESRPKVQEPVSGIVVTDSKSSLLEQIKNNFKNYDLKKAKKELKSLTKEEVQKLSELLASDKNLEDRLGRHYDLKDYVRIFKNSGNVDFELAKECLKNGFYLNYYYGLADTIDNNPARREVAFELLKLNSQFKQVKQHSAYEYQDNIIAESAYWNYLLKNIKTEEQKDAYLLYLKSVRLEEISEHSRTQPNMRYINNVDEMQAWLEIKDYNRSYRIEEFRQLYVKLSTEDRKLFTKEQFESENKWSNGFSDHIDIMKFLLDPKFPSEYKEEIREFLKKNSDHTMTFKIMRAIDHSGKKPVLNIEHFRRIARFANTGVEYDEYRFLNLTEGYEKEDGTFHYAYNNEYLDRWYEVLTDRAEEKTLGRRFTMEEAQDFSYIKEDWKKDYVIKNLKEGMNGFNISQLCQWVIHNVKTEEQLRITDILRKYKDGIPTKDGDPIKFDYNTNKCMTEKADIDTFCRIFDGEPLTRKQAELYSKLLGDGFGKRVELIENTPNLTKIILDLNSNYMKINDLYNKTNEFGQQAMLLLDKFVEVHPEMSEKIKSFLKTSSGDYECTLTRIKSQETVERIEKNLYKIDNMSPEDIEILKEFIADEVVFSDQKSFSSIITDCDFSIEKFDILKSLYLREKANGDLYGYDKYNYGKLLTKDYDIEILKKIVESSSKIDEVDSYIYSLDVCDHELVKTLLFDTDFNLDMIKDVVQQDINHFDRQDNTIEEVKQLAKTYKQKNISRNEAYLRMLNIREITQEMAQKMLAKAEKAEIEHAEINRKINPQKDYQPSEMHMLSYARTLSKLINESNKELINTLLNEDYFTVDKIKTICKKRFVFDELERWSPEKDMEKALDVAKNYKQYGMTSEEAYVMLLNIPAMTKTLARKIITRAKAEEVDIAQKENRNINEENIDEKLTENARAVQPETTELAEVLLEDANFTLNNVQDIINFKNDGYNSLSAVSQIMEIAKTYKQKDIDKTKAYLMMLNPFSITEKMAEKVLKQVKDEVKLSESLSSLLPNHKSRATDISRYEREGKELVRYISADKAELAEYLLDSPVWNDRTWKIKNVLEDTRNAHEVLDLCKNYEKYELTQEQAIQVIESRGKISARDLSKLNKLMGRKTVTEMTSTDRNTATRFVDVIDVQNINEITIGGKKKLLRALVDNNSGSFQISEKLRERLPIVPKNVDEYCPLLRSIVRAIGIETEALTPEQRLQMFNSSIKDLSKSLAELSDKDFADLTITLEEPREEFIEIVKEKIKGLSDLEKRKVFDYYGFELHRNKNNSTGYSITGYPVNLNNGQKLALIENPQTKAVVEALRPDVIKFSKQNRIKCSNSQIEQLLNDVLDGLPEIRTMVGKSQHGSHDFDVMQHSLKVMQKLVQDPNFEKLSENDQKIMLLASLLHDITKGEGYSDRTHATESSFDAFYIAQKFKLSRDDVLKLYTLIEHHEWLGNVNTKRSEEALTKALQRTAFYLQNDNLLELALMFTHADLKAVRKDNSFHDKTEGPSRINFRGEVHSFGEAADIHAQRIREYVKELKANKPFTPTTRIPKASAIKSRIGSIDPDGKVRDKAGNIINGLYVRESDGLVIIKHNEVTDWEAIGFSKGTTSKGITGIGKIRNKHETKGAEIDEAPYETGNVHYFMHGLDYPNQLIKFEAFTQPDSKVMLSVTYLERPESKPRGFRPQGVLLRYREKYVYGGGETDAGSGGGKFVDDFIRDYCFGGPREKDRTMVSELHKKSTGMSDEEYVRFIEENQNKEWTEIDPKIGNKMIKGLGDGIISTGRRHDRAYDEFYASNPEVEATFAYEENVDRTIDDPVKFVNENERRLNYLIKFNHDHDIPMVLLGD